MPLSAIHYEIEGRDEIHTDFSIWLHAIQNELQRSLRKREILGHTAEKTRHHSAFSLTGQGFTEAIANTNQHNPLPERSGHEGLRLSLRNTLEEMLRPFQTTFSLFVWEIHTYTQRRADGAVFQGDKEPLPMNQCWRLLYILEPAPPKDGPIAPPPNQPIGEAVIEKVQR